MPKIVDYGARMDLVAEATCALAARSGGAAVTVPAEERAWRALSAGSEPSALVAEAKGSRDVVLERAVRDLLLALGTSTLGHQQRLRALVDGLLTGLCDQRLDLAEVTTLLVAEVSHHPSGPRG